MKKKSLKDEIDRLNHMITAQIKLINDLYEEIRQLRADLIKKGPPYG